MDHITLILSAAGIALGGTLIWRGLQDQWRMADFFMVTASGSRLLENRPSIQGNYPKKKARPRSLSVLLSPAVWMSRIKLMVNARHQDTRPYLDVDVDERFICYRLHIPLLAFTDPDGVCDADDSTALGHIIADYIRDRYACPIQAFGVELVNHDSGVVSVMWTFRIPQSCP